MTIGADMSFDPNHTRLRKKANKQLKQTTSEQLEQETKKMEGRIRALKEQMVKEKEEREKYGGSRWMSGKTGPLLQQTSKKKPIKAEKGPRKIKLLTDEPLSSYTKKTVLRESLNESFGSDMTCGQCDKSKATLACVECTENYCVGCFMGFHRKGALRNHTTKNLDQVGSSLTDENGQTISRSDFKPRPPETRRFQNGSSPEMKNGGALLQGSYDEKESSESFAQALKEWRSSKQKENSWVNPADKVSSVSCETSTVPEKIYPAEINLNFGSNKSMSYLDRLVLKKHRDSDPVAATKRSPGTPRRNVTKSKETGIAEAPSDDFGVNYREIFQTIGVHSARAKSSPGTYCGRSSVTIEEVSGSLYDTEETTTCIIEESDSTSTSKIDDAVRKASPSRGGRVSILGMTPYGEFSEDPHLSPKISVRASSQARKSPLDRTKLISPTAPSRVWSPKPVYTGLSDFFLAGVKSQLSSPTPTGAQSSRVDNNPLTSKMLTKGIWKPDDSVFIEEFSDVEQSTEDEHVKQPPSFAVIPLVHEPARGTPKSTRLSNSNSLETGNSLELEVDNMQDFGINDFLKAAPVPRKSSQDYNDLHRVSTVSPLHLSPRPPKLHWSDDDSDDDVIVDAVSRVPETGKDFHGKEEQDEEDKATLEDLTWELASTTGRLTHLEGNLDDSLDNEDDHQDHSGDEDSIEEDNGGISLDEDSNDDDYDEDKETHKLDDSLMIEEVHALE